MSPVAHPRRAQGGETMQAATSYSRPSARHFLSVADLTTEEIQATLDRASQLKYDLKRGVTRPDLAGAVAALVFQKPSLRTRVSFEVGLLQLGAHALYLSSAEIQLGQREGVADAARVLSRYVQAIVARVFLHGDVVRLAEHATVPVINALSDLEHPCQALADLLTLRERMGKLRGLRLAYVGDGNNVANSLALAAALMGIELRIACPAGYEPDGHVLEQAAGSLDSREGSVELFHDPRQAVRGAHAVYTDTWYSMGQEDEAEVRQPIFQPYQVNSALLSEAQPDVLVMHCLPAHRGQEITDDVLDGPHAVAYDQAENRLHVQKALLLHLLGVSGGGAA